jgi:peptidoglycan/xylan/chitin deacetylase (PgdA/CDA1 family)
MGQYYQKVLTRTFSPLIAKTGISGLTKPFYSGKGQILMFHRVVPSSKKERIHNHLSLEISPEQLETIIQYFKNNGYDFIQSDHLMEWLKENKDTGRKFTVLTFDDGYKDNLEYAYPVLKKHSIPFTIYITTEFPDKRAIFWWYVIEDILLNNSKVSYSFSNAPVNIHCETYKRKESGFYHLRQMITSLNETNLKSELTGFFDKYGYDIYAYNDLITLDWNEIQELSADSLVTIGAHTLNHYNLTNLSNERSWEEIAESKKTIETRIKKPVGHFSYPLGLYGNREIEYVGQSGFFTATTTRTANVFYDHIDHPYTLPRISVNSLTTEDVLKLHVNGFFHAMLNKFTRIAV